MKVNVILTSLAISIAGTILYEFYIKPKLKGYLQ